METAFKIIIGLVALVAAALVLCLVGMFLHWLWMICFFSFHYGPAHTSPGQVLDVQYKAPYTTYTYSTTTVNNVTTTTMTPMHHPAQWNVLVKTNERSTTIDSQALYNRCGVSDTVELTFQRCFHLPRFWDGDMTFDSYRLISVNCPKGLVTFNDEKPVDRKVVQIEENMDLRK